MTAWLVLVLLCLVAQLVPVARVAGDLAQRSRRVAVNGMV